MSVLPPEHAASLWTFSLGFYASDGVCARLLEWQDGQHLDVNIVLCLCWHAARGIDLGSEEVNAMRAAVDPWRQDVIEPVRLARRAIKARDQLQAMPDADGLRQQLLQLELKLERSAQQRLQELSNARVGGTADAGDRPLGARLVNMLRLYAEACEARLPESEQRQLATYVEQFVGELRAR